MSGDERDEDVGERPEDANVSWGEEDTCVLPPNTGEGAGSLAPVTGDDPTMTGIFSGAGGGASGQPSASAMALEPTMDSRGDLSSSDQISSEVAFDHPAFGLGAHQVIGQHFEIIRRLGAGGMGEVYLARDTRLSRRVAIKTVLASRLTDPRRRARQLALFRRDAAATAQLQHPNIVTIHELGVDEARDLPFIVLEFLDGQGLDERLRFHTKLEIDEALRVMEQVGLALIHAHERGIVHRDLKPGNIFLLDDGRCKVLDFGVALIKLSQETMRREFERTDEELEDYLGEELDVAGTPKYMAPEQSLGEEQGPTVDIWALGIILYRLLTGELPFRSPLAAAMKPMPIPSDLRAETPAEVDRLVLECTRRDPSQRIQSAEDFVAHVRQIRSSLDYSPREPQVKPSINYTVPGDAFIGRSDVFTSLEDARLGGERLITVVGAGGSGKTRVCMEYGAATNNSWRGGVWCCELAEAKSLQDVLVAMSNAIDLPLTGGEPLVQLGDALSSKGRALMILDNFEQILTLAPIVLGYLVDRCKECTFLITSRIPLGFHGEHVIELGALELPRDRNLTEAKRSSAVALFVARAKEASRRFELDDSNAATVCELVGLLDGLPLALELAASRVRVMQPAKMLRRLERRFDLLRSTRRDLDPRQATLRATIDWSWDLLDRKGKVALAQLSVFEGGFSLSAAEEVLDLSCFSPRPYVVDVLEGLVRRSLITRVSDTSNEVRFSMLVSLHAYASEKLETLRDWIEEPSKEWASDLQERVNRTHGEVYARLGRRGALERLHRMGGGPRWRSLKRERDNLNVALSRARARQDYETATLCALAIGAMVELLGPFHLAEELFDGLLERRPRLASLTGRARLCYGVLSWMAGENQVAKTHQQEAVDLAIEIGDWHLEAEATYSLGVLTGELGETQRALELLERASDIAAEKGLERVLARSFMNRGILLQHRGEFDECARLYERARQLAANIGDQGTEGVIYSNIGVLAFARGRLEESRRALERSVELSRAANARRVEAAVIGNLAFLALQQERFEDAERGLERSLELARELGNKRTEGIVLGNLADLHRRLERFEDARQGLEDARVIAEHLEDQRWLAYWEFQIGEVLICQERYEDAVEILDTSIARFEDVQESERIARARSARGRALAYLGDLDAARAERAIVDGIATTLQLEDESELAIAFAELDAVIEALE